MLSLIIILLFLVAMSLIYIAICRYLYRRYSTSKEQYDSRLAEVQRELESNALGERLEIAEQAVEKAAIEKGILPELRSIVNNYLPSYNTSLTIPVASNLTEVAPGLAEVFDPAYEIITESRDKLEHLLGTMQGGSIGIAGPRGAGKTTLLRSFCGKSSTTRREGAPVLSVMTSAPVEYNAREFTLHLFSSVCQRALQLKNKATRQPWDYMSGMERAPITFFSTMISLREALTVVLLGFVLMSTLLISNLSDFFLDFFFGLGLFLVILGVVGLFIRVDHMLRQRRQTQLENQQKNEVTRGDALATEALGWLGMIKYQQSYSSGWAGSLKGTIAPIALEAKTEAGMQFHTNQMSLPEIVDRYQEFLELAREQYEIIIGIDELDKIGSDEQAQRFLNEIKALFGLKSCFYLISVSESAMSSFERRGLPFRDVFDSSFDAIVHADYLNLDKAQRLLRRRVIGVPVPFLDLCHCMAGGLPRDLIRIARGLVEEHIQTGSDENNLSTLCNSLIKSDLRTKLRAAAIAAKDVAAKDMMFEPQVNQLLERIRELESHLESTNGFSESSPALLKTYGDLLDTASQEPARRAETAESAANREENREKNREKIASLSTELGVYLYYSETLLEFFGREDFSLENLKTAESSGELEKLAKARQLFAISPRLADSMIRAFRDSHNMELPHGVSPNSYVSSEV